MSERIPDILPTGEVHPVAGLFPMRRHQPGSTGGTIGVPSPARS